MCLLFGYHVAILHVQDNSYPTKVRNSAVRLTALSHAVFNVSVVAVCTSGSCASQ